LSWIVQFQVGNPFATGKHGGFCELTQLPSVDKGFQDVLLDGEIIVADARQLVSELGQIFNRLLDPRVSDVIGRCFGAQAQVIADILLEKALSKGFLEMSKRQAGPIQDRKEGWQSYMAPLRSPRINLESISDFGWKADRADNNNRIH
jgi:hypothetical protein